MRSTIMSIIIILSSISEIAGQTTAKPVSISEGVTLYENVYIRNGENTTSGSIKEEIIKQGNNIAIVYTQKVGAGDFIDSVIVNATNGQPVRYSSNLEGVQTITVNYDNDRADVSIYRNTKNSKIDTTYTENLSEIRYDGVWRNALTYSIGNENLDGLRVPIYTYRDGKDHMSFTRISDEEVDLNGKTYFTTKYSVLEEGMELQYYFWVDKKSTRTIKYLVELDDTFTAGIQIKE